MSENWGQSLSVRAVHKSYGNKAILKDISFDLPAGKFMVLVGPSGCGKSTMLRSIAGLEPINSGFIRIGDREVSDVPPKDRDIAMVFQDYALYPHMTVYENIAFGLRVRGISKDIINQRVQAAAKKLNLTDYLQRKPAALSGGQRQRVAIGRAIVRQPKVFLFDEPLSNLDAKLRGSMRLELSKLHHDLNATVVYVTHDQVEAMTLADIIVVLDGGVVQQVGAPLDLYYHPVNTFVATFIGSPSMNLIKGQLNIRENNVEFASENSGVRFRLPRQFAERYRDAASKNTSVYWGVRPENLRVDFDESHGQLTFDARVEILEPHGASSVAVCDVAGNEFSVLLPEPHRPKRGANIQLCFVSKHLHLFDGTTGLAL